MSITYYRGSSHSADLHSAVFAIVRFGFRVIFKVYYKCVRIVRIGNFHGPIFYNKRGPPVSTYLSGS